MAGGRGDTELTDILKRVRGLAKKKSKRYRSPSSKRCSAKRPRKVQREKKAAAAEAAAAEAAAAEAAAEEAAAQEAAEMVDEVMELAASAVSDASFTPTDSDYERSQALSVIRAHHQYYVAQGIMYVTCYSSSCHFVLLCM